MSRGSIDHHFVYKILNFDPIFTLKCIVWALATVWCVARGSRLATVWCVARGSPLATVWCEARGSRLTIVWRVGRVWPQCGAWREGRTWPQLVWGQLVPENMGVYMSPKSPVNSHGTF